MSIWNRMRDITVATLNDKLEQSEDPVRLIDGYLDSVREQIRESERLLNQCASHTNTVRQKYVAAKAMRDKREEQAILALKAGEEEIARLALQDKLIQEEICNQYGPLYEEGKKSMFDLEEQIKQLKSNFDEVAVKRSYYMARMESARLQQRMNERLSGMNGNFSSRAFARLDEHISDMELQSRSLRDVRRATSQESGGYNYGGLQNKLDYEMERLRVKLEDTFHHVNNKLDGKLEEHLNLLEQKLEKTLSKLNGSDHSDKTK